MGKEQYPGMLEVELRIKEMYNRSNNVNENDLCSIIEMYMPDLSIDKVLESVKNLIGGETKNSLQQMCEKPTTLGVGWTAQNKK